MVKYWQFHVVPLSAVRAQNRLEQERRDDSDEGGGEEDASKEGQ